MEDEQTTTSVPTDDTQADDQNQPLPEPSTEDTEAESENLEDTEQNPQEDTTGSSDEELPEDEGKVLLEWAERKGIKLSDQPTEAELKLIKMQHDTEKKLHETATNESNLRKQLTSSDTEVDEDADPLEQDMQVVKAQLAAVERDRRVTEFYLDNPEARELDNDMAEIAKEEFASLVESGMNPVSAGNYVSNNLERLYQLAKVRSQSNSATEAAEKARREERELLQKKQTVSTPTASASTREVSKGVTDEDIANMSLEEYEAWKQAGNNPFIAPGR